MTLILDRRSMITGFAATAMAAASGNAALAAERKPFFQRVGRPIGLQLYTLGDEPSRDLDGTLARVAKIGYRDIEIPGLYGRKPAEMKAAAERAGLSISSIHLASMPNIPASSLSFDSEPQRIADDLGALGVHQAVLPMMPFSFTDIRPKPGEDFKAAIGRLFAEAGPDIWKRTAAQLNEKAASLKPFGISIGYHNHNVEFMRVGKTTGWDIITRETDPSLVTFEVDVGWVAAAGLDPVAFLRRYKGRVRQIHMKDIKASTKPNVVMAMDPSEVGSGKQDWARILPAAYKAGARNFYVEQEPPFTIPRMEAVERSFSFLAALRA